MIGSNLRSCLAVVQQKNTRQLTHAYRLRHDLSPPDAVPGVPPDVGVVVLVVKREAVPQLALRSAATAAALLRPRRRLDAHFFLQLPPGVVLVALSVSYYASCAQAGGGGGAVTSGDKGGGLPSPSPNTCPASRTRSEGWCQHCVTLRYVTCATLRYVTVCGSERGCLNTTESRQLASTKTLARHASVCPVYINPMCSLRFLE